MALAGFVELFDSCQQLFHLPQWPGIGSITEGFVRVRMGFHEYAGYTDCDRSAGQYRNEFPLPSRSTAKPARELHRVRGIKHHPATGLSQHSQRAHSMTR
jgi:hypothetical protein